MTEENIASPSPEAPAPAPKKTSHLTLIISGAIVVCLLVVLGVVFFVNGNSSSSSTTPKEVGGSTAPATPGVYVNANPGPGTVQGAVQANSDVYAKSCVPAGNSIDVSGKVKNVSGYVRSYRIYVSVADPQGIKAIQLVRVDDVQSGAAPVSWSATIPVKVSSVAACYTQVETNAATK